MLNLVGFNFRIVDIPDHCRSGPLESQHQSVQLECGFVEAFEHADLAVVADKRDGEAVAVRRRLMRPARMESGSGSSVASCFSTP